MWMNCKRFIWINITEKRRKAHSRINACGNRYLRNYPPGGRGQPPPVVELWSSMVCEAGTSDHLRWRECQSILHGKSSDFTDAGTHKAICDPTFLISVCQRALEEIERENKSSIAFNARSWESGIPDRQC